jgi:hypothetical protein
MNRWAAFLRAGADAPGFARRCIDSMLEPFVGVAFAGAVIASASIASNPFAVGNRRVQVVNTEMQ